MSEMAYDLSVAIGFILTTWYVNLRSVSHTLHTTKRFILTTWYVNDAMVEFALTENKSFILTTWYVNLEDTIPSTSLEVVLY